MAMEGKIPFIYSIIPFVTMRNFEQIRNDICYQNLNVKIIGIGAGFYYGPYGRTHHGLEDIGILRTLPNLLIFSPADEYETQRVVELSLQTKKPCYIRLGKVGTTPIHKKKMNFPIGKGIVIEKGKDICLIATGGIVKTALKLRTELLKKNIAATVISMPTLKPIDQKLITEMAKNHKALFSLEEHSIIGGLGSIVSEIIAEKNISITFKRIGIPDKITHFVGDQEFMESKHNLSVKKILKTIQENYA
jgi:transketolase